VIACGELDEPRLVSSHTDTGIWTPRRTVALRDRGMRSDTAQRLPAGVVGSVGAFSSGYPMCST
jgi:hypothetical protein